MWSPSWSVLFQISCRLSQGPCKYLWNYSQLILVLKFQHISLKVATDDENKDVNFHLSTQKREFIQKTPIGTPHRWDTIINWIDIYIIICIWAVTEYDGKYYYKILYFNTENKTFPHSYFFPTATLVLKVSTLIICFREVIIFILLHSYQR